MANPTGKILIRSRDLILLHWFNALCWLFLTASGLGIIRGEALLVVPQGWSTFMQNLVGGNDNLVLMHSLLGLLWCGVFVLFTLRNWKSVVQPFLAQILTITPKSILLDSRSMMMTIAQLFGLMKRHPLPPVKRYNGSQRLLGTMILACSVVIAISGLWMFFGPSLQMAPVLFRWALVLHALCIALVWIGLIAHIYYGIIEERESLEGMKSGYLDVAFIKHHNPGWYKELKQQGKIQ